MRWQSCVAAVPYAWGLAVWLVASFAAYLATMRAILPRPETLLVAAAFPAVFVNVGHGQNGFLTAALLGGALHWLDRRPWLAGVLIGCLAYKPQFGVLIPIALLAADDGTRSAAAIATVAALVVGQLRDARQRRLARLRRLHEFHADRRARTGRHRLGEDPVDLFGGADVGRQRRRPPMPRRLALGADARRKRWPGCGTAMPPSNSRPPRWPARSLLATPYVLDYDLVVLAVAIAFFARHGLTHGFRDFEISLLAAAWLVPLLSRGVAGATGMPLGLIVLLTLYGFILRRAVLRSCGLGGNDAPNSASVIRIVPMC